MLFRSARGGDADGWPHALFRFIDRTTGHAADTSFGGHIFNTVMTYKGEPQSYTGKPPGLSTRLFLRLGSDPLDTYCHLIYPASTPWHPHSSTELVLHRADGERIASRHLEIPCGGSRAFRSRETFSPEERHRAGANAYVVKSASTAELLGGIRAAAAGQRFLCSEATTVLLGRNGKSNAEVTPPVSVLTGREREVLQGIAEGQIGRAHV